MLQGAIGEHKRYSCIKKWARGCITRTQSSHAASSDIEDSEHHPRHSKITESVGDNGRHAFVVKAMAYSTQNAQDLHAPIMQ